MSDLKIYVGVQHDGATFQLSPASRWWLEAEQIGLGVKSLFIASKEEDAFEQIWAPRAPQIVSLLTGAPTEELFRFQDAEFLSPKDDSVLMRVAFQVPPRAHHG